MTRSKNTFYRYEHGAEGGRRGTRAVAPHTPEVRQTSMRRGDPGSHSRRGVVGRVIPAYPGSRAHAQHTYKSAYTPRRTWNWEPSSFLACLLTSPRLHTSHATSFRLAWEIIGLIGSLVQLSSSSSSLVSLTLFLKRLRSICSSMRAFYGVRILELLFSPSNNNVSESVCLSVIVHVGRMD